MKNIVFLSIIILWGCTVNPNNQTGNPTPVPKIDPQVIQFFARNIGCNCIGYLSQNSYTVNKETATYNFGMTENLSRIDLIITNNNMTSSPILNLYKNDVIIWTDRITPANNYIETITIGTDYNAGDTMYYQITTCPDAGVWSGSMDVFAKTFLEY